MTRVAFQGELGAFSEQGVRQLWPDDVEPVPMREFLDVARAVEAGEVELGLLPIENTLAGRDRKSTRLNSSHANISYAVFCLKKKKNTPAYTAFRILSASRHPSSGSSCYLTTSLDTPISKPYPNQCHTI